MSTSDQLRAIGLQPSLVTEAAEANEAREVALVEIARMDRRATHLERRAGRALLRSNERRKALRTAVLLRRTAGLLRAEHGVA